jgi:hypothetical protein
VTPVFFFASAFSSLTSDEVHARRITFFFFILVPFLWTGFLSHQISFATRTSPRARTNVIWQNDLLTYFGRSGTTLGKRSTPLNNTPQMKVAK